MSETVENRNIFGLHGITGALIATVLLLSILVVLTILAIGTQQAQAENFYDIKADQLKMINDGSSADYIVDVKAK